MSAPPIAVVRPVVPAVRTTAYALSLLALAHFVIDMYAGALGSLQPLLVSKLNLSLAQAGLLGGLLILSSSVSQPLYGYLADRFHTRMFTVLAPAVAGVFISSVGLATGFGSLVALVMLAGVGVASFHPQASARVTQGVVESRGTWMAVFISGGTLGMAFGPAYFSWAPEWFGLEHMYWAGVPGVVCSGLLLAALSETPRPPASARKRIDFSVLRPVARPLALLFGCVFLRSVVQVTFAQLLPLYLSRERGMTVANASYTLSAYLAAGALGGFLGGRLADRVGGRRVIMLSMVLSVPPLALFFATTGWVSIAALLVGGLILLFTIPVNVVMAQELAPTQTGTVSAIMMGFAWGTAGLIFMPLAGWLSDRWSMHAVLSVFALAPLAGFELARRLPRH